GALEFRELVDVTADLAGELGRMVLTFHAHDDALRVHGVDEAVTARQHHSAGIARGHALHAGADNRRRRAKQRYGLALHVGAHQSAVGVIVLQERNQRSRLRYQLLGAHVDVVDFLPGYQHEVTGFAGVHQLGGDASLIVQLHVGLGDHVTVLFPRGEVEGERLEIDQLLAALAQIGVALLGFLHLNVVAYAVIAVAGVDHGYKIDHPRFAHAPVGRLDEAVIVDAGIAAQRADQTDVRTFRSLDRADAAVVRGMDVTHLESGTLAGKTARPQGGETPFVRDLRE